MLVLAACAAAWGCASEEIPKYGEPAQGVGGSTGGTAGTGGTGGACEVDPACAVKFGTDVFPVLDTTSKCADAGLCHGNGMSPGGLALEAGNAADYHGALTSFVLADGGKYVVPCDPGNSKLLCNLKVSDGDNPHGECGKATMPVAAADAPTLAQLQAIEDWIECGAPNN